MKPSVTLLGQRVFARAVPPRFGNDPMKPGGSSGGNPPPAPQGPPNPVPAKDPELTKRTLNEIVYPWQTTKTGFVRAGVILKMIDIAASISAKKHAGKKVVTASLDRLNFINPVKVWELVSAKCRVTKAWNKSVEVQVKITAEDVRDLISGNERPIGTGYLVFVAVDDQMKPTWLPKVDAKTAEDKRLEAEAEMRKQNRLLEEKQVGDENKTRIVGSDHPVIVRRTMTENEANINNKVFGGVILELSHLAGERAAERHTGSPVVALQQDRMNFEQPAGIGEVITSRAVVTRVWNKSMEVKVEVEARNPKSKTKRTVASSYYVFVAHDKNGKPKPLPPFTPKTPRQIQRWHDADIRRAIRLKERKITQQKP